MNNVTIADGTLTVEPLGLDKVWSFTNYAGGDTFHGWIDDFALYGRVLTTAEISKLSVAP